MDGAGAMVLLIVLGPVLGRNEYDGNGDGDAGAAAAASSASSTHPTCDCVEGMMTMMMSREV